MTSVEVKKVPRGWWKVRMRGGKVEKYKVAKKEV